jgi:hypothetical protein
MLLPGWSELNRVTQRITLFVELFSQNRWADYSDSEHLQYDLAATFRSLYSWRSTFLSYHEESFMSYRS